jgi:hypothetical protein
MPSFFHWLSSLSYCAVRYLLPKCYFSKESVYLPGFHPDDSVSEALGDMFGRRAQIMGELEGKRCSGVRFDGYSSTLDVPCTKIGSKGLFISLQRQTVSL